MYLGVCIWAGVCEYTLMSFFSLYKKQKKSLEQLGSVHNNVETVATL